MKASVSQGGADSNHVGGGDEVTQLPPENEGVPMLMMMIIVMAAGYQ